MCNFPYISAQITYKYLALHRSYCTELQCQATNAGVSNVTKRLKLTQA